MAKAPFDLICIYTSGMRPLQENLGQHDDWGVKYFQESYYALEEMKSVCTALYQKAHDLISENSSFVFCQIWTKEKDTFVALAVSAQENNLRNTILFAVYRSSQSPKETLAILSRLQWQGESLPYGLEKIKKDTACEISLAETNAPITLFVYQESPDSRPVVKVSKSTTQHKIPIMKTRSNNVRLIAIAIALLIGVIVLKWGFKNDTSVSPIQNTLVTPTPYNSYDSTREKLEEQKLDLEHKLNLANIQLRKLEQDLSEQKTLASTLGGWQSLKDFVVSIEKLDIPLEHLEREVQQGKHSKRQIQHIKTSLRSLVHYLKKAQIGEGSQWNERGEKVKTKTIKAYELENALQQIEKLLKE